MQSIITLVLTRNTKFTMYNGRYLMKPLGHVLPVNKALNILPLQLPALLWGLLANKGRKTSSTCTHTRCETVFQRVVFIFQVSESGL